MAFSIQTNVNSLIAQENLRVNSNFQSQTIQRLTSGYRINSSGDDAAGLAIANKFRSDTAELTQGVRNANDGVAQLQIMDGGMNNIGKMLDRLKTLATQSASSTFTGDRSVLNSEYQTLVGEIDRQAQGIGLSTGGHFATQMGVYIGGGTSAAGTADTANGTVVLNLANSVVDAKALGLVTSDFEVVTAGATDIGAGSATSVAAIASANASADSGKATFNVSGPGFASTAITVNITGMTKPQSVADAINSALGAAANSDSNFQKAGLSASVRTNSDGTQQLVFSSNGSAFQVQAGTATAHDFTVNIASGDTAASGLLGKITAATSGGKTLAQWGVTVTEDGNNRLQFSGPAGQSMQVAVAGDTGNFLGLGSWMGDFATNSYATGAGTAVVGAGTGVMEFSINGGDKIAVQLGDTSSLSAIAQSITNAVGNNSTLAAAGITAVANDATHITISSSNSTNFRINLASLSNASVDLQLGGASNLVSGGNAQASAGSLVAMTAQNGRVDSAGASETGLGSTNDVFSFKALVNHGDQQTLDFSSVDSVGALQATSITLNTSNASSLDQALSSINAQLKTNSTLKNIVAVKDMSSDGTSEGIRFISSDSSFSVKVGNATNFTDANPVGMYDGTSGASSKQGMTVDSSASGSMDITTAAGAERAVVALGQAVEKLGSAQAAIGKGQNQLGYAISLANSQISNFSSAQSQIRDADVAAEAANLSKAQVLQQASIAAMAQANSAPQAVLALLRG